MTRGPGTRRGRLGMLGLGGYGLGLTLLGLVGLLAPFASSPSSAASPGGRGVAAPAHPLVLAGDPEPLPSTAPEPGSSPLPVLEGSTAQRPAAVPDGGPVDSRLPRAERGTSAEVRKAFRPLRLVLPGGSTAPVQRAEVRGDGSLEVPVKPTRVGWWTGGSLAGEQFGTTVIAGHVDSRLLGIGVLAPVAHARPGQVVRLRSGRQEVRYRILTVTKVPQADLTEGTDAFRKDGPHRLVLITCGGPFDRKNHRYTDNVVVVAAPIR